MPQSQTADFLIIGGGIVGLSLALECKRRHPGAAVTVLEKEEQCGLHASGRNSGVLHAGFYYAADSLKARLTRDGNRRMTEYCRERGLQVHACGKLVVAKNEQELAGLRELLRRASRNGVELHEIGVEEARSIEPRIRTHGPALFSPTTSSVNPKEVVDAFVRDAAAAGVRILTGTAYVERRDDMVRTTTGRIGAGYVINAAGLYADRVAHDFGFGADYAILPFKGLFLYATPGTIHLNTNVYPVPFLGNPWLGVHFTVTVDGRVKIGPTAIPAMWREHYDGWRNFTMRECFEIARREWQLFVSNSFDFRRLAVEELRKYSRRHLVAQGAALVEGVRRSDFRTWGPAGIRAQLVDVRARKLEMDFRFEGDDRSFHVLNAVSPAFTCALSFGEYLMDRVDEHVS